MEVVETQVRDNTPPETRQALTRLISEAIPEKEAKGLIAFVVLSEMNDMLKNGEEFDRARFVRGLSQLPGLKIEN